MSDARPVFQIEDDVAFRKKIRRAKFSTDAEIVASVRKLMAEDASLSSSKAIRRELREVLTKDELDDLETHQRRITRIIRAKP